MSLLDRVEDAAADLDAGQFAQGTDAAEDVISAGIVGPDHIEDQLSLGCDQLRVGNHGQRRSIQKDHIRSLLHLFKNVPEFFACQKVRAVITIGRSRDDVHAHPMLMIVDDCLVESGLSADDAADPRVGAADVHDPLNRRVSEIAVDHGDPLPVLGEGDRQIHENGGLAFLGDGAGHHEHLAARLLHLALNAGPDHVDGFHVVPLDVVVQKADACLVCAPAQLLVVIGQAPQVGSVDGGLEVVLCPDRPVHRHDHEGDQDAQRKAVESEAVDLPPSYDDPVARGRDALVVDDRQAGLSDNVAGNLRIVADHGLKDLIGKVRVLRRHLDRQQISSLDRRYGDRRHILQSQVCLNDIGQDPAGKNVREDLAQLLSALGVAVAGVLAGCDGNRTAGNVRRHIILIEAMVGVCAEQNREGDDDPPGLLQGLQKVLENLIEIKLFQLDLLILHLITHARTPYRSTFSGS